VAPGGIGLWGLSEGGWIAPMVAAGNPQVAAVLVVSPPGVVPASQEDWAVRRSLETGGAGSSGGAVSRYYAVAGDLGAIGGPHATDLRFDPAPLWRRVSQPVLAAWGTRDDVVPAHASAAAIRTALAAGGVNHDRSFRVFPGATHVLGVASESYRPGSAPGFKDLSATWLRDHLGKRRARAAVSTPLPPPDSAPVREVQPASVLEHWPVQLAWLVLPAFGLLFLGLRAWRRRGDDRVEPRTWWWLGGVVALDVLALCALAFAVATIVEVDGHGVEAVAGVPAVLLATWVVALAGAVATGLLARRARRHRGTPATGVCLASAAWLLLVAYWLV
jgi:dienelactone hydrolase